MAQFITYDPRATANILTLVAYVASIVLNGITIYTIHKPVPLTFDLTTPTFWTVSVLLAVFIVQAVIHIVKLSGVPLGRLLNTLVTWGVWFPENHLSVQIGIIRVLGVYNPAWFNAVLAGQAWKRAVMGCSFAYWALSVMLGACVHVFQPVDFVDNDVGSKWVIALLAASMAYLVATPVTYVLVFIKLKGSSLSSTTKRVSRRLALISLADWTVHFLVYLAIGAMGALDLPLFHVLSVLVVLQSFATATVYLTMSKPLREAFPTLRLVCASQKTSVLRI